MATTNRTPICPYADTAENLELRNDVLVAGQKVYDLTNKKYKTGDGVNPWNNLSYDSTLSGDGNGETELFIINVSLDASTNKFSIGNITFNDIQNAYNEGKTVLIVAKDIPMKGMVLSTAIPLTYLIKDVMAVFASLGDEDATWGNVLGTQVIIYPDNSMDLQTPTFITSKSVKNEMHNSPDMIPTGQAVDGYVTECVNKAKTELKEDIEKSKEPFIITVTDELKHNEETGNIEVYYSFDKTCTEIFSAINSNVEIIIKPVGSGPSKVVAMYHGINESSMVCVASGGRFIDYYQFTYNNEMEYINITMQSSYIFNDSEIQEKIAQSNHILLVNIYFDEEKDNYISSSTFDEIVNAHKEGKLVLLNTKAYTEYDSYLTIGNISSTQIEFAGVVNANDIENEESAMILSWKQKKDESWEVSFYHVANTFKVERELEGKADTDLSNVSNEDFKTKAEAAGVGTGDSEELDDLWGNTTLYIGEKYVTSTGVINTSASWKAILITNIDEYEKYIFDGYNNSVNVYNVGFYSTTNPTNETYISGFSFYDKANDISKSTWNHNIRHNYVLEKRELPEGTKSIIFCSRKSSETTEEPTTLYGVKPTIADKLTYIESEIVKRYGNVKAIFKNIPNSNDFAVIKDEIWFSQNIYQDGVATEFTTIHRYKIVDGRLVHISDIDSDFGHWNCVDYCEENDCLVFGNGANLETTDNNFFVVVKNPLALGEVARIETCGIKYLVNIGFKVQAVWGDNNFGKNNIVYLLSNNTQNVTKVMLLKDENGDFNGEYITLEESETNVTIGSGGCDFWGDNLYIGNGAKYGLDVMSMTDYSVKSIVKKYYYDDGTEYVGSTQGVHIDSKYIWVFSNVKYEDGKPLENYLIQYCR